MVTVIEIEKDSAAGLTLAVKVAASFVLLFIQQVAPRVNTLSDCNRHVVSYTSGSIRVDINFALLTD